MLSVLRVLGSIYHGQVVSSSTPYGYGRMEHPGSGISISGNFKNGKYVGRCMLESKNETIYAEWREKREGKGLVVRKDGTQLIEE